VGIGARDHCESAEIIILTAGGLGGLVELLLSATRLASSVAVWCLATTKGRGKVGELVESTTTAEVYGSVVSLVTTASGGHRCETSDVAELAVAAHALGGVEGGLLEVGGFTARRLGSASRDDVTVAAAGL
jgi:hypothetical protein